MLQTHTLNILSLLLQQTLFFRAILGNSLAVQWLGLRALIAKGLGSISGQGTKIPQAVPHGQKNKKRAVLGSQQNQMEGAKISLSIMFVFCLFGFLNKFIYFIYSFKKKFFLMLFLSAYILFMYVCMYVCMYGCVGSSFLCEGFLQLRQAGATLHHGARASHYRGLSLRSTGSRRADSVVVAHGPSRSAACGIFPDQGPNPRPLHWQADSQPLRHQGSPIYSFLTALGLRCCTRATSSCGEQGLLFIVVCGPLVVVASPAAEHRL